MDVGAPRGKKERKKAEFPGWMKKTGFVSLSRPILSTGLYSSALRSQASMAYAHGFSDGKG